MVWNLSFCLQVCWRCLASRHLTKDQLRNKIYDQDLACIYPWFYTDNFWLKWCEEGEEAAFAMKKNRHAVPIGVWDLGFGIWDLGFGIWDLGFGIWDLGFGIWDLGFGIWDLGFGIWDLGFGSWDLGFGIWDLAILIELTEHI